MVEMENKDKVIVDMGVEDMIKVWEEMAREDMPIPTPSLQGGGGGRRQSQDFRNLVDIFEYGGGGSDVTQPGLKKIVPNPCASRCAASRICTMAAATPR